MSCPHCHEAARFVDYRPKTVQSLVGTFPLKRADYHCPSCGAGAIPWDEALGLSRQALTPGARELVGIAGAVDSFAEAADVVLRKLSGLHVSESTAERTSEAAGRASGPRQAAGETLGTSPPWAWHKDAEGKTWASISLDLTGLGMQGPDGAAAEGRQGLRIKIERMGKIEKQALESDFDQGSSCVSGGCSSTPSPRLIIPLRPLERFAEFLFCPRYPAFIYDTEHSEPHRRCQVLRDRPPDALA